MFRFREILARILVFFLCHAPGLRPSFHLKERYITRIDIFIPKDVLRLTFGIALKSDNPRRFVCEEVIKGSCSDFLDATDDCEASLQALPLTEGPDHHIDGNTQGCRALHAVFAKTNPEAHCAHLSFSPLKDPNGNLVCQNSAFLPPSELFTESDFASYEQFALTVGIDPEVSHDIRKRTI
jgi:hypothetical protein